LLDDVAGGLLVLGSLGCLAAALRRPGAALPRLVLAAALALAAAAEIAGETTAALGLAAAGLMVLGLVLLVLERFESVPRLSWLDAVMGASASAALLAAFGASTPYVVAVGGVVGTFALSRWQPGPSMLLAAAGLIAYSAGDVGAVIAAPLFAGAAWRQDARQGPGPDFRWTVLVALMVFATAALTLLTLGQFTDFSVVTSVGAIVTVLVGMARAGMTVTQRLHESTRRALTDDLTGLSNRRYLLERLDAAIERGGDIALLLVDLDGFKELNDTLGHHAGDQVLRQIGPRLAGSVREHDTIARLGGDEFALVLAPGDESGASAAGLRLRAALERSFHVEGITVHIDASVGIALFPEHASTGLGLLQRADVAMYEAKRKRTGHEVYLPARDQHSRDKLALMGELHDAIETGQLVLHYQPKAELATGRVDGVEALVRWQHPRRGLLEPRHFLPIAEQSGLTRSLTAFVLNRALLDLERGRSIGLDLEVAVNLGPADLLDLDLPEEVELALERHSSPPSRLRMEVSEDVVMADPERTVEVLERLQALGVGLALDDFGAGHSSLRHLKDLRVHELKIDRSFVLGMTENDHDEAIVRTAVDLGRRLGLRVVAEGVASREAWDLLTACACDAAQGFFLARPMPAADLADWLQRRPRIAATGATRQPG